MKQISNASTTGQDSCVEDVNKVSASHLPPHSAKSALAGLVLGVHLKLGGRNPTAAYVSPSIAFVTTIRVFTYRYHIYLQINNHGKFADNSSPGL